MPVGLGAAPVNRLGSGSPRGDREIGITPHARASAAGTIVQQTEGYFLPDGASLVLIVITADERNHPPRLPDAAMTRPRATAYAIALIAIAAAAAIEAPAVRASASTVWDRARDATQSERDYAHVYAIGQEREADLYEALANAGSEPSGFDRARAVLARENARDVLERFGARNSDDLRLRFDLGRVLARLERCDEARLLLQSALRAAPDEPNTSAAWFDLAICDARLGLRSEEERAYLSALDLADDPPERAVLFGNLAEARMGLGNLEGALEAADFALGLAPDAVLVRWTLAVIHDRAGDSFGALEEARLAIGADPDYARLRSPGVFFDPEYEVRWYEGLGEIAHALAEPPKTAAWELHLFTALHAFHLYVQAAPLTDRWRARAIERAHDLERTLGLTTKSTKK